MGRKALAGAKVAKKKGEPAIKFGAGIDLRNTGTGTGYLDKGVRSIKNSKNKRQKAIDEIMEEL